MSKLINIDTVTAKVKVAGASATFLRIADEECSEYVKLLPSLNENIRKWVIRSLPDSEKEAIYKWRHLIVDRKSFFVSSNLPMSEILIRMVEMTIGFTDEVKHYYSLLAIAQSMGYDKTIEGVDKLFSDYLLYKKDEDIIIYRFKDKVVNMDDYHKEAENSNKRIRGKVREAFNKNRVKYSSKYYDNQEAERIRKKALPFG